MPLPLELASLILADDGTPISPAYGDVYHSAAGGHAQAKHVFMAGNGLPERWQRASRFVILETGFGLGINFLATWLAERHGLQAVLVNPGVLAPLTLSDYLGPQTHMYTGEPFDFTTTHIDALRALDVPAITRPERYWLMVETGDEVLDYRAAVAHYPGARQTVLEGGDHSFTRWGDYLDPILEFAGLLPK
mgnify:CR=1 FL=1